MMNQSGAAIVVPSGSRRVEMPCRAGERLFIIRYGGSAAQRNKIVENTLLARPRPISSSRSHSRFGQTLPSEVHTMKRWIAVIVLVIGLSGVTTYMTQIATNSETEPKHAVNEGKGPQPKVFIAAPLIFDFGTMSQRRKSSHVWEIKNAGDAELQVWLEESTCSCTVGKLQLTAEGAKEGRPRVHIKPNETTPITLEWDTKTFPTSYSQGVTIGTNDLAKPTFMLTVKGAVYPPVQVYPADGVNLSAISNEEVSGTMVAVYSMDMPNMKVTKASTSRPDFFKASYKPMTADERKQLHVSAGGYRVEVEIKPGMPLGQFAETLVVETDHPLQKELTVSIHGYTTGPISIIPSKLSMRVNGANGGTTFMSVNVRGGEKVKFVVVQKPGEHVDITITPYDPKNENGRYRMTMTVPPGTPASRMDKDLIIRTNHPRATEIKIPADIIVTRLGSG
jgi:Protein of unknown function (DUF1573)